MSHRKICMAALLTICLSIAGCGDKQQVVEVSGVVTLDGKPLELVQVEFWPSEGTRSIGKTDNQGRYTLKADDGTFDGAVPGKHKVALRDTWPSKDDYLNDGGEWVDKSNGKKSRIHSKYYDAPTSPLSVDVTPGKPNVIDFQADPRK